MEARLAELRRLADQERIVQSGAGGSPMAFCSSLCPSELCARPLSVRTSTIHHGLGTVRWHSVPRQAHARGMIGSVTCEGYVPSW
jgi:hypothetical protein